MKSYSYKDKPLKVYGVPMFEKDGSLCKMPGYLREKYKLYKIIGGRCGGGRIRFKTNSKNLTVHIKLETLSVDIGLSIYTVQSADIFVGAPGQMKFLGLVYPNGYEQKEFQQTFKLSGEMQDVTIFIPRNEIVENVVVDIDDDAQVEEPTPYKYEKPVLFYGSSITEAGSACRVSNCFVSMLSEKLNMNFINFGLAGSARGQLDVAEYIASLDFSAFVMEYDHNANTAQLLKESHEPFFRVIRDAHPDIPMLLMSAVDYDYIDDADKREEVVYTTYKNSVDRGDKNIYFIPGRELFGETDRQLCTSDTIHPNDLGHYRMANKIEPVLRKMLEK
ncbi:MAG: hypothetical protein IJC89_06055 [Clostridia bacterium]|nr:hypothetical protein [Clostridia bacterium]